MTKFIPSLCYCGIGLAAYLLFHASHVDFNDPWLYLLTFAWPVVFVAVFLKWLILALCAAGVVAACWAIVEYIRR